MNPTPTIKNVLAYISSELDSNPNRKELNLQFRDIQDLLPYVNLLSKFPRLQKLMLHGNRLKELPTDLSPLSNLEELDLSNNLLDDNKLGMMLISLKTLPKLKVLHCQVSKEKEKRIVEEIKSLEFLNNTKIIREKIKKQYEYEKTNQRTLSEFQNKIVDKFNELLVFQRKYVGQIIESEAVSKFREQLHSISKECLDKLNLDRSSATNSLEIIMLYNTKFQMYENLKQRGIDICTDVYGDFGKFLKSILDQQDKLFKNMSQQALSLARLELDAIQKQEAQKQQNQFQSQHSIVNKNAIMQAEIKRMRKQKDQFIAEINQLQNQNKKLVDALVKYSRGDLNSLTKALPMIATFQSKNSNPSQGGVNLRDSKQINFQNRSSISFAKPAEKKTNKSQIQRQVTQTYQANYQSTGRNLTLKQTKEFIEEIYQAKMKFDLKNMTNKIARQTMNQYFFAYLNNKYGLKSLTIEAASSIVSAIEMYSAEDNDVTVFGKILRNEIDQEFKNVQTELKITINNLIKQSIKAKTSFKTSAQIQELLNERVNGQISYEDCSQIVKYLYNRSDEMMIMAKLDQIFKKIQINKEDSMASQNRRKKEGGHEKRKIKFNTFVQAVLEYQMKNHQKLIKPLVNAFRMKDHDLDGIIDEEQFISIIEVLCPEESEELVPTLLDIVDPYETKKIAFTQMVRLVSNYPEHRPILARFVNNDKDEDEYQ